MQTVAVFPLAFVRDSLRSAVNRNIRENRQKANAVIYSPVKRGVSCGINPIIASVGITHWANFSGKQFRGCWIDNSFSQVFSA